MGTDPSTTLSNDPGDEMQRRLRYQAAYGAILSLQSVDSSDVVEVFCEHHEDLLVRRVNGKYVGVQVKTRHPHLGPFKTDDAAVVTALQRFVALDLQFPNKFEQFILVANCDFWQMEKNGKNLPHVVSMFQQKPEARVSGTIQTVFASIRDACKCSNKEIIPAIQKVRLDGTVPKFEDITLHVAYHIGNLKSFKDRYFPELIDAATDLINLILEASALACHLPLRTHFVLSTSPGDTLAKVTIEKKKITAALVLSTITQALQTAAQLQTATPVDVSRMPRGHHKLEKKMAAGGISFQSIDSAKDQQRSAEFLLQSWLHKFGDRIANERYSQLHVMVKTQCAEAFDNAQSATEPFGAKMLSDVRARLQMMAKTDGAAVFQARYEHLLGIASMATEECKIWWSEKFDIDSGQPA